MAIVKFIPARKPQSSGGMYGSMEYCKQEHKTWDEVTMRHLVTGINCVASTAYREFMNTKRFYEKTGGRMYYHVVQSFSPEEELTAETAHEIALKLAAQFSGFEVLVCTHTDRDHLHSHLIINSVNAEDGRKYHSDKDNIQRIRMASDELCMQYGLSVVKPKQKRTPGMSAAEYRSADKGESWKLRLAIAIDDAMIVARSRAHFIELMEMEGYLVRWDKDRKYITYTTPEGKQCRDIRLHEAKYLKENMEREFRLRKQILYGLEETGQAGYECRSQSGTRLSGYREELGQRAELHGRDSEMQSQFLDQMQTLATREELEKTLDRQRTMMQMHLDDMKTRTAEFRTSIETTGNNLEKQVGKASEEFSKALSKEEAYMRQWSKKLIWISLIPSAALVLLELVPLLWSVVFPG